MLLLRELKNPELTHLNVSSVEISRDGKKAFVYFTSLQDALGHLSEEGRESLERKMREATPALFYSLRKKLSMKYVPNLEFRYDKKWTEVSRIWGLTANLAPSRTDERPEGDAV